jgi:hypothetical protein
MGELLNSARLESKKKFNLPEGATIISKSVNLSVEEIENGYILRKSYDIKWSNEEGENQYDYFTKSWYSKENPITVNMPKDKSLADKLD